MGLDAYYNQGQDMLNMLGDMETERMEREPVSYIVELSEGCWISSFGRTCVRESAKEYPTISSATYALAYRRRYRDWKNAKVLPQTSEEAQGE